MKKICFISGDISRSGGTERVGTIIANELSQRGYSVSILSFWKGAGSYFHVNPNIKVDSLLCAKEGKLYRTYIYPIIKLHNYIKSNDIDVIIDIDTALSVYSCMAIIGTKCKLISWEHFNYWTMLKLNDKKRFKAKTLIKKHASKLVVLTEEDRLKHIEEYNLQSGFIVTIPNPCLLNIDNNYNFEHKTFLAVGRLAPQKNFSALLDAWAQIQQQCPDWQLVIVGKGELEAELKSQAAKLILQRVTFAGHTDNVEHYYQTASCFVLSSEYEGFPMVILEAQSYGLPVISFDCKTGPRDLVTDGINGHLVEDGNVEQFADRMLLFTLDEEKAKKMSVNAINGVKQFNMETIMKKWTNLIEEVGR